MDGANLWIADGLTALMVQGSPGSPLAVAVCSQLGPSWEQLGRNLWTRTVGFVSITGISHVSQNLGSAAQVSQLRKVPLSNAGL